MGIFDKLFKKKQPQPLTAEEKKTLEKKKLHKKAVNEDTRPIVLPKEKEDDDRIIVRKVEQEKSTSVLSTAQESLQRDRDMLDVKMADEDIDDAIDSSFDALFGDDDAEDGDGDSESGYALSEEEIARDREETRELFGQIAVNYIRPVKQFIFELKKGAASSDWIQVCLPAIKAMLSSMKTMGLEEEEGVLQVFYTYLEELQNRNVKLIDGEYQSIALELYSHLEQVLPMTFELGEEEVQREGIIILSLLKQVPEVGKVTLDKLFAAGLSTLDMLFLATTHDLSRTTGIPERIADQIVQKIQQYKEESQQRPVDEDMGSIQEMLAGLMDSLMNYHELYEDLIANGWNDPEFNSKKKRYRKLRQEASLKINVLLAELGEVELVEQIEKLPFDRRAQKLKEYLESAQNEQ